MFPTEVAMIYMNYKMSASDTFLVIDIVLTEYCFLSESCVLLKVIFLKI